jgi:hypothetical protein
MMKIIAITTAYMMILYSISAVDDTNRYAILNKRSIKDISIMFEDYK